MPDGSYTVYAVKAGIRPQPGHPHRLRAGLGNATLSLTAGGLATVSLTSNRITDYQTLINDGIDPNDPNNYNIYQFFIHLVFEDTDCRWADMYPRAEVRRRWHRVYL